MILSYNNCIQLISFIFILFFYIGIIKNSNLLVINTKQFKKIIIKMIARPLGSPRKIKRTVQEETDPQARNTLKYQFYRNIIHPTILKLTNEIGIMLLINFKYII